LERRPGIIVVVGGAIAFLFTLAMFLGSGLMCHETKKKEDAA
jgi:hypothetical protein